MIPIKPGTARRLGLTEPEQVDRSIYGQLSAEIAAGAPAVEMMDTLLKFRDVQFITKEQFYELARQMAEWKPS